MCGVHFIDFSSVSSRLPLLILNKSVLSLPLLMQFLPHLKAKKRVLGKPGDYLPRLTPFLPPSPRGLSGSSCCLSWGTALLPSKLHWENLKTAVAEQQGPDGSATGAGAELLFCFFFERGKKRGTVEKREGGNAQAGTALSQLDPQVRSRCGRGSEPTCPPKSPKVLSGGNREPVYLYS